MGKMVGIRLIGSDTVYYYDPQDLELKVLDKVVVDIEDSKHIAWVTISSDQIVYSDVKEPLPHILRLATQEDLDSKEDAGVNANLQDSD